MLLFRFTFTDGHTANLYFPHYDAAQRCLIEPPFAEDWNVKSLRISVRRLNKIEREHGQVINVAAIGYCEDLPVHLSAFHGEITYSIC